MFKFVIDSSGNQDYLQKKRKNNIREKNNEKSNEGTIKTNNKLELNWSANGKNNFDNVHINFTDIPKINFLKLR